MGESFFCYGVGLTEVFFFSLAEFQKSLSVTASVSFYKING